MRMFSRWSAVAVVALTLAGCGAEEDDLAQFIGEWQYTSGTENTQCQSINYNDLSQLTGQKVRISKGVDVPLVYSETDTNCVWKLSVNGNVASVNSGQTCMFTEDGITFTGMYTAGTLTVTGTTATFSGSATASAIVQGLSVNCSITGTGGLTKVAN